MAASATKAYTGLTRFAERAYGCQTKPWFTLLASMYQPATSPEALLVEGRVPWGGNTPGVDVPASGALKFMKCPSALAFEPVEGVVRVEVRPCGFTGEVDAEWGGAEACAGCGWVVECDERAVRGEDETVLYAVLVYGVPGHHAFRSDAGGDRSRPSSGRVDGHDGPVRRAHEAVPITR